MTEADWKLFKTIKEIAIEKYCRQCLSEFLKNIENESVDIHERYRLNYQLVQDRDRIMNVLFGSHSRSTASLQLLAMRRAGLAEKALVSKLSTDLQKRTDPEGF